MTNGVDQTNESAKCAELNEETRISTSEQENIKTRHFGTITPDSPNAVPVEDTAFGDYRSGRIDVDIETIVLKALEKEPDPACPPSPFYQLKKLVARHKFAFASLATIFLLIVGFAAAMAAQSVRIAAVEANDQKRAAENEAEANRQFLYASQVNLAQQAWDQADITHMHELLDNQIPKNGRKDLRGFEWFYLWNLSHRMQWATPLAGTALYSAFSPTGDSIFVSGYLGPAPGTGPQRITTKILDTQTGKELPVLEESSFAIGYLSNGRLLVEKSSKLEVLDLKTGKKEALRIQLPSRSSQYVLSPDGRILVVLIQRGEGESLEAYDVTSGKLIFSLSEVFYANYLWGPRPWKFKSDGKLLALDGRDGIRFWDTATGRELPGFANKNIGKIQYLSKSIALSPDGTIVAIKMLDNSVHLWNVLQRQELGRLESQDIGSTSLWNSEMGFSPDGHFLGVPNQSRVEVWDVAAKKQVYTLKGHTAAVMSVIFSSDATRLVTISNNESIILWKVPPVSNEMATGAPSKTKTRISPDGKRLATLDMNGELTVRDIATNNELMSVELDEGSQESEKKEANFVPRFSHDGRIVAVSPAFRFESVSFWNVSTGRKIATLKDKGCSLAFVSGQEQVAIITEDGKW